MTTFTPSGKAHMALARLSEGPATLSELRSVSGVEIANQRRKHWYVLNALTEAGFVTLTEGFYEITPAGRDALQTLRDGFSVSTEQPVPNVRIFGRAA